MSQKDMRLKVAREEALQDLDILIEAHTKLSQATELLKEARNAMKGGNLDGVADVHYCSKCGISINGKLLKATLHKIEGFLKGGSDDVK